MNRILKISLLPVFITLFCEVYGQVVYAPPAKKLIDFGWNSPFVSQYAANMQHYENGPFDGITLKLSKEVCGGNVFMVDNWAKTPASAKEAEKKLILSLKTSSILTDNFIVLYGASQMDWFSDEDWALAEDQLRFAAGLAKAGKCRGIIWDPEPYKPGKNPWNYKEQEKAGQYSLEQYYVQIRKRGSRFIEVLQDAYPGLTILSLRELSDWQIGSPFSGALLPVTNRESVIKELGNAWWGLHPAFYAGIIDAIRPGTEFIDANEEAYFYTSPLEYYKVRSTLADDAKALIPPELWEKHSMYSRIGHAVSADYIAGNWLGMSPFPYRLTGQGLMMTPEDRAKWFGHNAYYALKTTDKYVWLYTEDMNWWTGQNVPDGFRDALLVAKQRVSAGEPLSYDIDYIIKTAQEKAEKYYKNKKE